MLLALISAVAVCAYAAYAVDVNRRLEEGKSLDKSEMKTNKALSVLLLVLAILAALYCAYEMFVSEEHKQRVKAHFS